MAAVGNVIDVAGKDVSMGTGHGQSLPGMRLNVDDFLAPKSAPYASVEPEFYQNQFCSKPKPWSDHNPHDPICTAQKPSRTDCIFEPCVTLGSQVQVGMFAGWIHSPDTPWRASTPVYFRAAGSVVCQRAVCATRRGDCLFQVLAEYSALH